MDPNAALSTIRARVSKFKAMADAGVNERLDSDDTADVFQLVEEIDALDEWLTKRGFLPAVWAEAPGTDPFTVAEDAWTDPALKAEIEKLLPTLTDPTSAVAAVMGVLGNICDSVDRELAFTLVSKDKGWPYDDLYNAWIEGTWD